MAFFNLKAFRPFILLLISGLMIFMSACGTAERTTKKERDKTAQQEENPFSDEEPTPPSDDGAVLPSAKTLVITEDKNAKAIDLIENGRASWYGPNFHGKLTANGEQYDMYGMTAAHRTLPFNTLVLVENIDSGKTVVVRINDRGPFAKNRIIDLSKKAARKIEMIGPGTANVNLYVAKDILKGSKTTNLKVPTYTVQLGSFDTEAKAFTYSSKIKGSRVEMIRIGNQKVYRVYYGLYIDKDKAAEQQRELERKNFSGYVKQIENG